MLGTIVVAGSLAQKPYRGGHAWVFLQYLLGFKRLGWDVVFIDVLSPSMCVDARGARCPLDRSINLAYVAEVMDHAGLTGAWALLADDSGECHGMARPDVEARLRGSAFLLNVNGYLRDEAMLAAAPRRVFLDIDPGVLQMWQDLGLHDIFAGHDDFVTVGQRIGQPDCSVPTCGRRWIPTAPPVVLDRWPVSPARRRVFTSVGAWRGAFGLVEYHGRTYGPRVHQFRKFVDLPHLTGAAFEIALDIHPDERPDLALLGQHGWSLVDPLDVARDPWTYQAYLQQSAAEFMVAKGVYVDTRCGWVSDRTVCYLASGKPVVAQETGPSDLYPTGRGWLTFTTLDEAAAAVREVDGRYDQHAAMARELAERFFDSDVVLRALLARLKIRSPAR